MDFQIPFLSYAARYSYKYQALYHALRDSIANGILADGTRLPSARELAAKYMLSRGIVNTVYEMLSAEGYILAERGRGTFVCFRSPVMPTEGKRSPIRMSDWANRIQCLPARQNSKSGENLISFKLGLPDRIHFPEAEWRRFVYREIRQSAGNWSGDSMHTQGHLPLREAIAAHLRRARGIDAAASNIVIVNGSQQAIALITQLLVNEGDSVVVENPGHVGTRRAIEAVGGIPIPADVDEKGIIAEDWHSKLLFVTPSRQFPTGAVLSLERRQRLLEWASAKGAIIVEDDYDSEFRSGGHPIEPLKVLDREDRVAYIGTFSKTMQTDLRIGYALLPVELVPLFIEAKRLYEPHPTGIIEQRSLAAFMNSGRYERHLHRMTRVYGRKACQFSQWLQTELGHLFTFLPSDAGLHIYGRWRMSQAAYRPFLKLCREQGVEWNDTSEYFFTTPVPCACFGFSHLSDEELSFGIQLIARIWEFCKKDLSLL